MPGSAPAMIGPLFDTAERAQLSDLLDELGPGAPTLLAPWTARDIAAHLVLRERDYLGGPGLVLPGAWGRLAGRRASALSQTDFTSLVATLRSGPPPGFFRIRWVRRVPSLNEFFVHHEDVRRANGRSPRTHEPAMDEALWRNATPRVLVPRAAAARRRTRACVGRDRPDCPGPAGGTHGPHHRTTRRTAALPLRPDRRGTGRGQRARHGSRSSAARTVRHVTAPSAGAQLSDEASSGMPFGTIAAIFFYAALR